MALREFTCVACDKKFLQGKWAGCQSVGGANHVVEDKTYYVPSEGLTVYYTQQTMTPNIHGQAQITPAKRLEFIRGTYTTNDPEKQAFLDTYGGIVPRDVWEQTHIPLKERQAKTKREQAAAESNLKATNIELEKLKAEIAAAKAEKEKLAEVK
jgi:hypothetical protein